MAQTRLEERMDVVDEDIKGVKEDVGRIKDGMLH